MPWVDVEQAVLDKVADLGTGTTRTGTDLQQLLGTVAAPTAVLRAHRTGGSDRGWQVQARITLDVYALTREKAWATAEAAAERLTATGGFRINGRVVDRVVSESANAELPYPDADVRVVSAIYRVTARR